MADVKYRPVPRMSSNKFAEYANTASAARRQRIVREQAFQQTILTARYRIARAAIVAGVLRGALDEEWLAREEVRIRAMSNGKTWTENDLDLTLLAIGRAVQYSKLFVLKKGRWARPEGRLQDIRIDKLRVSVCPDLLQVDSETGAVIGALKLVFSKTRLVPATEGAYSATLVGELLRARFGVPYKGGPYATVIDVLHGEKHIAPIGVKRRFEDLVASAAEIVRRWPSATGAVAA